MVYDCMIIGGGIAGLQAAIQLGRYQYNVLLIDANKGRSNLCRCYHNLLGWPDGVSGETLRTLGRKQVKRLGVTMIEDTVEKIEHKNDLFAAYTEKLDHYEARRLLLSTGIKDNIPPFQEIYPCLGISIFVCPDCDGYEVLNQPAVVIGSGNAGASMALALTHWTSDITCINHGLEPIDKDNEAKMQKKKIAVHHEKIMAIHTKGPHLEAILLESGRELHTRFGFLALGGNVVNTALAAQIGVELEKSRHIKADPRTKMTNVQNVWAAGDIVAHSEQVAIAMGDGVQAAIWIHKSLQKEKR